MRKITITAPGGQRLTGQLPDALNWDDVRLDHYAAIVAAQQPERTDVPALCRAVAQLTGLPAEPFLEDTSLMASIIEAAPWLFGGQLPPSGEPVPVFTHAGTTYAHVGNLARISAGQLEALYDFLQANTGGPITCAPQLLAVLYAPLDAEPLFGKARPRVQTPEIVRDASAAFASLPMSIAWPALADFTGSSSRAALNIQTVSALSAQVENLLSTLEAATTGASGTFWRKPLNWLTRTWLRNVRKML